MKKVIQRVLAYFGYRLIRWEFLEELNNDFYLYEYESYDEYKRTQIEHNLRKEGTVYSDEATLRKLSSRLILEFNTSKISGICHGSRNGFEQNFFNSLDNRFEVIGTDISDSATKYPNSVVWDFHDTNKSWISNFNFIYSNSLDQSYKPQLALKTWLNQLVLGGLLIIEHGKNHSPTAANKMDPFGVRPSVFCHIISGWFGHQVSIDFLKSVKSNSKQETFCFIIKKLEPNIELLKGNSELFLE